MKITKVKKCPFCNKIPSFKQTQDKCSFWVECNKCKSSGPVLVLPAITFNRYRRSRFQRGLVTKRRFQTLESKEKAIKGWNIISDAEYVDKKVIFQKVKDAS